MLKTCMVETDSDTLGRTESWLALKEGIPAMHFSLRDVSRMLCITSLDHALILCCYDH